MYPDVEYLTKRTHRNINSKDSSLSDISTETKHLKDLYESGLISDSLFHFSLYQLLEKYFASEFESKLEKYYSDYFYNLI